MAIATTSAVDDTHESGGADHMRRPWPPFARDNRDRWLAGVAGGLGRWLRVDSLLVRAGFVVLALAGGLGVALYLAVWATAADPDPDPAGAPTNAVASPADPRQAGALGMVVIGLLVFCRDVGLWFGDELVWPVALAITGMAVIWSRSGRDRQPTALRFAGEARSSLFEGRRALLRVTTGSVLVFAGVGAVLVVNTDLAAAGSVLLAVLLTAAGLAVILGPWLWHLGRQLVDERRERIRSEERAEVAAHLHDSVLQTLALIQHAGDAQQAGLLARRQERELRAWLYGHGRDTDSQRLREAVESLADRIEGMHGTRVEVVVVGDATLDDTGQAVVAACGEAATNAAKHSGADRISIYVEVEDEAVSAFVRDRGRGFDPDHLPPDARGIADSIVGRVERRGGRARINSEPGVGTEVSLRVPTRTVEHEEPR